MIDITILGVAVPAPAQASDTNWSAAQVALEQALAAGINTNAANIIAPLSWTAVTYAGAWEDTSGGQAGQHALGANGVVWVRAGCEGDASGTTVFTLPVGRRPPAVLNFLIYAPTGVGRATVNTNGTVVLSNLTAGSDVGAGCFLAFNFSITA